MPLNIDKCMVLTVTFKNNPITSHYVLHSHRLVSVILPSTHLGVIIDSKLSFNEHIDSACKKANSTLAFLCRNFGSCQRKIKTDLYFTYVSEKFAKSTDSKHINMAIPSCRRLKQCNA